MLPQSVCQSCVKGAEATAAYQKCCRESEAKWTELTEQLAQLKYDENKAKTVFVVVERSSMKFMGYKHVVQKTSTSVLKAFKRRINNMSRSGKIKWLKKYNFSSNSSVRCPECRMPFLSPCYLNMHLKYSKLRVCPLCNQTVKVDKLKDHLTTHGQKVISCKICSEVFYLATKLKMHIKKCHTGPKYCADCKQSFKSEKSFNGHSRTHQITVCQGCEKKFNNKKCFVYHRRSCRNFTEMDNRVFCDYCLKSYINKNALRIHISHEHLFGPQHQCEECGKKFISLAHLKEHSNTHTKVYDRFSCEFCTRVYSSRRGYEKHVMKHFEDPAQAKDYLKLAKSEAKASKGNREL